MNHHNKKPKYQNQSKQHPLYLQENNKNYNTSNYKGYFFKLKILRWLLPIFL